jgi:hypothetical protein
MSVAELVNPTIEVAQEESEEARATIPGAMLRQLRRELPDGSLIEFEESPRGGPTTSPLSARGATGSRQARGSPIRSARSQAFLYGPRSEASKGCLSRSRRARSTRTA